MPCRICKILGHNKRTHRRYLRRRRLNLDNTHNTNICINDNLQVSNPILFRQNAYSIPSDIPSPPPLRRRSTIFTFDRENKENDIQETKNVENIISSETLIPPPLLCNKKEIDTCSVNEEENEKFDIKFVLMNFFIIVIVNIMKFMIITNRLNHTNN